MGADCGQNCCLRRNLPQVGWGRNGSPSNASERSSAVGQLDSKTNQGTASAATNAPLKEEYSLKEEKRARDLRAEAAESFKFSTGEGATCRPERPP